MNFGRVRIYRAPEDGGGSATELLSSPPPADGGGAPPAAAAGPWDGLPDDIKSFVEMKGFKDVASLAQSAYHANKHISGARDVVALPADDAPAEVWDRFHTAMGRPATATEYQFTFGEGVQPDTEFVGFAQNLFHGMGLNPKQAQTAVNQWQEFVTGRIAADEAKMAADMEAETAALKQTWGKDWDANVAAGQRVVKSLGLPDEILTKLEATAGFGATMHLFATLGKKVGGEDTFHAAGGGGGGFTADMTPEQANVEIARLAADKAFADSLFDPNHAQHKDNAKKWADLHAITTRRR